MSRGECAPNRDLNVTWLLTELNHQQGTDALLDGDASLQCSGAATTTSGRCPSDSDKMARIRGYGAACPFLAGRDPRLCKAASRIFHDPARSSLLGM